MTTSTEMNLSSREIFDPLYSKEDIKKQCFNAMRDFDPPCKFQTILFSVNSSHPENCAHCVAERGNFGGSADTRFVTELVVVVSLLERRARVTTKKTNARSDGPVWIVPCAMCPIRVRLSS